MFEKVYALKKELIETGVSGLAVDIDETLSWTVKYWMDQLSEHFGNPSGLTTEELIAKYRYTQAVPHWQTNDALRWMEEATANDSIQENLPLIDGADSSIKTIHQEIIPIVLYPTVRPEGTGNGTQKWLTKHQFPNAKLLLRPAEIARTEGNKWKAKVLEILYPQVRGIIDDNPGLPMALSADYEGVVFLYNNTECERKDIKVVPCKTWGEVLRRAKEVFGSKD